MFYFLHQCVSFGFHLKQAQIWGIWKWTPHGPDSLVLSRSWLNQWFMVILASGLLNCVHAFGSLTDISHMTDWLIAAVTRAFSPMAASLCMSQLVRRSNPSPQPLLALFTIKCHLIPGLMLCCFTCFHFHSQKGFCLFKEKWLLVRVNVHAGQEGCVFLFITLCVNAFLIYNHFVLFC